MYSGKLFNKKSIPALVIALILIVSAMTSLGIDSNSSSKARTNNDLVLHLQLDEGKGSKVMDASGNGQHGTNYGANWSKGLSNWGLEFEDGNYLELNESDKIVGSNPSEWSYTLWMQTTNKEQYMHLISDYNAHGHSYDATYGIHVAMTKTGMFEAYVRENWNHVLCTSEQGYNDGEWHMVSVTVSKLKNSLKLYVDGGFVNSTKLPSSSADYFDSHKLHVGTHFNFWVGTWNIIPTNNFTGFMDEILIYKKMLNASEIKQLYEEHSIKVVADKSVYTPNSEVCLSVSCTGDTDASFQVDKPNGAKLIIKTVSLIKKDGVYKGNLTFKLPDDAPLGRYNVTVSNEAGRASTYFTVSKPEIIIKSYILPENVKVGGKATFKLTLWNGFSDSKDVYIVIQVMTPSKIPLSPVIETATLQSISSKEVSMDVEIPSDSEKGKYSVQFQIMSALPSDGGSAYCYTDTMFQVS